MVPVTIGPGGPPGIRIPALRIAGRGTAPWQSPTSPSNPSGGSRSVVSEVPVAPVRRPTPKSPRPSPVGRYLGPLVAYHVLIVSGGAVFLVGAVWRSAWWTGFGLAVLIGGIAIHVWVLYSTAKRVPQGPVLSPRPSAGGTARAGPVAHSVWMCPTCGFRGELDLPNCPRCGKFLVRIALG